MQAVTSKTKFYVSAERRYAIKKLMFGNEAGVSVVSSYPGTPSTEITENIVKYDDIYVEWAPNEKVAGDIGCYTLGASAPLASVDTTICMCRRTRYGKGERT